MAKAATYKPVKGKPTHFTHTVGENNRNEFKSYKDCFGNGFVWSGNVLKHKDEESDHTLNGSVKDVLTDCFQQDFYYTWVHNAETCIGWKLDRDKDGEWWISATKKDNKLNCHHFGQFTDHDTKDNQIQYKTMDSTSRPKTKAEKAAAEAAEKAAGGGSSWSSADIVIPDKM
eukprot:TRINITY_DN48061_c0_g1_i1.p1 TRINITY_DN48061_c0_g1~~TRINITY_DN48061_c0_g1_i1.p1  ORF type:complete len:172 (+),score=38.21 TRINITY_DN48061_c0_g1_i1:61-576(+)